MADLPKDNLGKQKLLASEVEPSARKAARVLLNLGLKPGDVVHVSVPNTTEMIGIILGTWLCRGISSIVDPTLKEQTAALQIQDSLPKIIVCHRGKRIA